MQSIADDTTVFPFVLDRAQVQGLIPHRGGILFARRIEVLADDHFRGSVVWAADGLGLDGHFPGCPLVPGVFLIEAAAQIAGAALLAAQQALGNATAPRLGMLAGTRSCSFRRPVLPGEMVQFELRARRLGEQMVQVSGAAHVGDVLAASLDLLLIHAAAADLQRLLPGLRLPASSPAPSTHA